MDRQLSHPKPLATPAATWSVETKMEVTRKHSRGGQSRWINALEAPVGKLKESDGFPKLRQERKVPTVCLA